MDQHEAHQLNDLLKTSQKALPAVDLKLASADDLEGLISSTGSITAFSPKLIAEETTETKQKVEDKKFIQARVEKNLNCSPDSFEYLQAKFDTDHDGNKGTTSVMKTQTFKAGPAKELDEEKIEPYVKLLIFWMIESAIKQHGGDKKSSAPKRHSDGGSLIDDSRGSPSEYMESKFKKEKVEKIIKVETERPESSLTAMLTQTSIGRKSSETPCIIEGKQKLRVYFFGSNTKVELSISKTSKVDDVIRQILMHCSNSPGLNNLFKMQGIADSPNKFNPLAYDLRLLDDEESGSFTPLYELAPLARLKRIRDFEVESVALCRSKTFKKANQQIALVPPAIPPSNKEENKPTFASDGKIQLKIHIAFLKGTEIVLTVTADAAQTLKDLLQIVSTYFGIEFHPNNYCFSAYNPALSKRHSVIDLLKYNSMNNASMLNMNSIIKNITFTELSLLEKIIADDPLAKKKPFCRVDSTPDMMKLQQTIIDSISDSRTLSPERGKESSSWESVEKYVMPEYNEFEALKYNPNGSTTEVMVGVDGVNLYYSKKDAQQKSKGSFIKYSSIQVKEYKELVKIPMKCVKKIEKTIFDAKKFYIFYTDPKNKANRIDFEFLSDEAAAQFVETTSFILKSIKR